uniref:Transmembrane protein n=1 Tax=Tanacetum cinerariifolium TaxID=118510 RepID=A0A6L2KQP2_TANCI|nr:hypothetical protein [Tanacetum cinerariifolium]
MTHGRLSRRLKKVGRVGGSKNQGGDEMGVVVVLWPSVFTWRLRWVMELLMEMSWRHDKLQILIVDCFSWLILCFCSSWSDDLPLVIVVTIIGVVIVVTIIGVVVVVIVGVFSMVAACASRAAATLSAISCLMAA